MEETTAGLRERKHHLSAYLRKVKAGETVTITDRGTPIGRIVPAEDRDRRTLEEKLQALQDAESPRGAERSPNRASPSPKIKAAA
jgi:prevent-host-death family protein